MPNHQVLITLNYLLDLVVHNGSAMTLMHARSVHAVNDLVGSNYVVTHTELSGRENISDSASDARCFRCWIVPDILRQFNSCASKKLHTHPFRFKQISNSFHML